MGISYYLIIIFGLPLTFAYSTLRQSVAGNSTLRGIVYCNLGTPKTVISNFVTTQILFPHISPYGYRAKNGRRHKKVFLKNVLLPWLLRISSNPCCGEVARLWTSRATFRCSGGGGAGGAAAARWRYNDGDGNGGCPMAATVTQYAAGGADGDGWRRQRRRGGRQRRSKCCCVE
jgi:hypothetical protein